MKFSRHPSEELVALFSKRPYQGQSPEKARIIFLSSDASNFVNGQVIYVDGGVLAAL